MGVLGGDGWRGLVINKIEIQTVQMEKPRSLDSLLRNHSITADEFFQVPGIAQQVRSHLDRFANYLRRHRSFAHRMLALALNITYAELENPPTKTASHAINEVLANEEAAIADLFFEPPLSDSPDIPQELDGGIQSEAERLFNFDDDEPEEPEEERAIELERQELVGVSLEILRNPQRNETCLGHLHKIYSFLIRHNPLPVLAFFASHPEERSLLLKNLRFSSVSSLVAQLLTSEDKSRTYCHEGFKRQIVQFVISQMFAQLGDEAYFDGLMVLLEQIINTTKQSYYEYFQDFKRVANLLVSRSVMERLLNILLTPSEPSFRNASKYLQYLFTRINTEKEDNSYYHRGEDPEPSMIFEVDVFYQHMESLLQLVPHVHLFPALTKISFLAFLDALVNSVKMKERPYSLTHPSFLGLIDSLNRTERAGVYKSKLYTLIASLISRATPEDIAEFLNQQTTLFGAYFGAIRTANYSNTKTYNKNQATAFDVSIIRELSKKNEIVIGDASRALGKDFKRICKKYETKIASFQNNSFSVEQESNFYQYSNEPTRQSDSIPNFALNLVGKNNISIPILHLPERTHTESEESKERTPLRSEQPRQVYEVEEIVVLNHSLQNLALNRYSEPQMERPPELERLHADEKSKLELSPDKPKHEISSSRPVSPLQPTDSKPSPKAISSIPTLNLSVGKGKCGEESQKSRFYLRHLQLFL